MLKLHIENILVREEKIMAEWISKKLGEITLFITKGIPPKYVEEENQNTVRVLNQKCNRNFEISYDESRIHNAEIKKVPEDKLLRCGDVLINSTGTGTAGRVAQLFNVSVPTTIDGHMILLRPTEEINSIYYGYAIKSQQKKIESLAEGSTGQTEINRQRLKDEIIITFPKEKMLQKAIGTLLLQIDEKIKNNKQINNNLEEQALAVFANEFLSLDTIPEGWKQASLIDIADYLNGLAMQKYRPTADEIGIPVLKIKELRQGCCDDNSELCSPSIKSDYIIHDGDVIFSWSGSLLVDIWCGGICGLNQHLFKVTSSKYDKWFYYAWTKHHLDRFVTVAADKATTMGHIKRDELAKAEVLIPNETDYNRIGALLQPIYEMIISNRIENKKLAATRDTLLPKLMNGEIDMSEVDYE